MAAPKTTVLVTGSSGLIGRALCHRLGSAGCQIIGFDMDGSPYPPPNTDCIFVDMGNDESVQNAFHIVEDRYGNKIDYVVHLAAYYSFSGHSSPLYHTLTVEGTGRLLRELHRFKVAQFIFSSTMLVHAPGRPGQKINEDSPLRATWDYPKSKIETEQLIKDKHGNIPAVILRVAGIYSDLCQSIPIAHQIQRIYEKQLTSHFYPGDLNAGQSFVHLDDLIDAMVLAMQRRDELDPYSVMLIGEEDTMTYNDLQHEIGKLIHGKEWATEYIPKPIAKAGAWVQDAIPLGDEPFIKPWMIERADDNYNLVTSRAKHLLGWRPLHSLRGALPIMIKGLLADPVRWYEVNKLEHDHHLHLRQKNSDHEHRKSA